MKIVRRKDGFWVTDLPDGEELGPYTKLSDAQEDRDGVRKFYQNIDRRAFFTSLKEPKSGGSVR